MPLEAIDNKAIAQRIISLMRHLGYKNEREWSKALGYDRPDNLYNATSGERMPGIPLLVSISNKFENVNVGWILTGNGDMIANKKAEALEAPAPELLNTLKSQAAALLLSLRKLSSEMAVHPEEENSNQDEAYSDFESDKMKSIGKQ